MQASLQASYANLFLAIIAAFACRYLDIFCRQENDSIGFRDFPPSRLHPQEFVLELCETCHLNNYLICMAAAARNALKCKLKEEKIRKTRVQSSGDPISPTFFPIFFFFSDWLIWGCVSEKFKLIAARFVEQINPICAKCKIACSSICSISAEPFLLGMDGYLYVFSYLFIVFLYLFFGPAVSTFPLFV